MKFCLHFSLVKNFSLLTVVTQFGDIYELTMRQKVIAVFMNRVYFSFAGGIFKMDSGDKTVVDIDGNTLEGVRINIFFFGEI